MDDHEAMKKKHDATVALFVVVFRRMCDEHKIPQDQRRTVKLRNFIKWARDAWDNLPSFEICHEAEVDEDIWEFASALLMNHKGMGLGMVWPRIAMCDVQVPKHKLKSVAVQLLITWEDGSMVPLQSFVPRELSGDYGLTDPIVVAIGHQMMGGLLEMVGSEGLDSLHETAAENYGGDQPYAVMVGAFMQIIPQLKAEFRPFMQKYLRLLRRMICPEIPPAMKAQMEAANAKDRGIVGGAGSGGGWDQG